MLKTTQTTPVLHIRSFALITESISCGIVLTNLCNVTAFISIQSCINFWPRFCIDDRRVEPLLKPFPFTPNNFNGVKVRTLWWTIHVWKWLLVLPDTHVSSCSFTTRAWSILLLSSWNMPEPTGKKKSIDGITWSFSTFRNSADLQCLNLTTWSNPRS